MSEQPNTSGKCDGCGRQVGRRYLVLDVDGRRLMLCDLCEQWRAAQGVA